MTSEERDIRAMTREFADGEVCPRAAAWDAQRRLDEDVFRSLAEFGFLGMRIPEEFGGLGLDMCSYLGALEELARGDASLALSVSLQNGPVTGLLLAHASEELQREILPGIASGELLVAFALGEREAAGDLDSMTAVAVPAEGGWRLTGRKHWVVDGGRAGAAVVFARSDPQKRGGDGIGAFLVDTSAPGYRVTRREETLGLCSAEIVEIELLDLLVPPDRVIGNVARGAMYARESLHISRLGGAAQALGIAQAAFEHAADYAAEREQFGRALSRFGAIQQKLAGMATRIAAARALMREAALRLEASESRGRAGHALPADRPDTTATAYMARLAASDAAVEVTREAVQIFGGYGYMRDYPVEKLMRDAGGTGICEATGEVLRMIAARDYATRDATG